MVYVDNLKNAVDFLLGVLFIVNFCKSLKQLIVLQVAILIFIKCDENFLQTTLLFFGHHILDHHRQGCLLQFLCGTEAL
jgi:hypothetical protein